MWLIEFSGTGSFLADHRDELATFGELQNAGIGAAVAFGDEDVAVLRRCHVVWLIEIAGFRCASRRAEGHQQFSLGAELEDLVPRRRTRRRALPFGCSSRRRALLCRSVILAIGDPN